LLDKRLFDFDSLRSSQHVEGDEDAWLDHDPETHA